MSGPVVLRGSSWDHERGHSPMVATAAEYERHCGGAVRIEWEPRSLKAFGMAHVEELAADFDLILIDHPHIGAMAESGAVVPLDELVDPDAIAELAEGSPGRSHQSYEYDGHLWALAVDAACHVAAWRPDLITDVPRHLGRSIRAGASQGRSCGRCATSTPPLVSCRWRPWPAGPAGSVKVSSWIVTLVASRSRRCVL